MWVHGKPKACTLLGGGPYVWSRARADTAKASKKITRRARP
jgi:hypothetical protein